MPAVQEIISLRTVFGKCLFVAKWMLSSSGYMAALVNAGKIIVFHALIFQSVSEWFVIVKTKNPIMSIAIVVSQYLLGTSLGIKPAWG